MTFTGPLAEKIKSAQEKVRNAKDREQPLEQLGWLFVAQARTGYDDGCYRLAGLCADGMDQVRAGSIDALLLRGHVLHSLHQFKAAEPLARDLVRRRGSPADFGLLGDLLMEQGLLNDAIESYQSMVDLRPDLQAFARIGHLRWLKGDLRGAIQAMEMATKGASPLDADSSAWVWTKLAALHLQSGDLGRARGELRAALECVPDYAPALVWQARADLGLGQTDRAVTSLRRAVELQPLPDTLWALADALSLTGRKDEAVSVEWELLRSGESLDPRSFAVFLASRGREIARARRLAEDELQVRGDVFTHDAVAWAHYASGAMEQSVSAMKLALREGTVEPRLLCHAAIIFSHAGETEALSSVEKSLARLAWLLWPSERAALREAIPDFSEAVEPSASIRVSDVR